MRHICSEQQEYYEKLRERAAQAAAGERRITVKRRWERDEKYYEKRILGVGKQLKKNLDSLYMWQEARRQVEQAEGWTVK